MDTHRAIFERTVSWPLVKDRLTDVLLGQLMGETADRLIRDVLEQVAQSPTLLKRWTRQDSLDQLPPLVSERIVYEWRLRGRGTHEEATGLLLLRSARIVPQKAKNGSL